MSDPISTHAREAAEKCRQYVDPGDGIYRSHWPCDGYHHEAALEACQRAIDAALAEKEQECAAKDRRITDLEGQLSEAHSRLHSDQPSCPHCRGEIGAVLTTVAAIGMITDERDDLKARVQELERDLLQISPDALEKWQLVKQERDQLRDEVARLKGELAFARKIVMRTGGLEDKLSAETKARAEEQQRAAKLVEALQWCNDWLNGNRYAAAACHPEEALAEYQQQTRKEGEPTFDPAAAQPTECPACNRLVEALEAYDSAQLAGEEAQEMLERAHAEGWDNDPTGSGHLWDAKERESKAWDRFTLLKLEALAEHRKESK